MREEQNVIQIKMEKADEGPTTTNVTMETPPSPSSSAFPNTLDVTQLKEEHGKIRESNKILTVALNTKSAEITNLQRQLFLERDKYSDLENFAYQSSRALIEMLGDMKTCLDLTRGGKEKEGEEEDKVEKILAEFPQILKSLKENLGKMGGSDRQGIIKGIGFLWAAIREINQDLAIHMAIKTPEEEPLNLTVGENLNGGAAEAAGAAPPMEMDVDFNDDDDVVFIEAVDKMKGPGPSTSTSGTGGCKIGRPVASTLAEGVAEICGPQPGPSGLSMLATATTVTTAVEAQDPTAAEIAAQAQNVNNLREADTSSGMGGKTIDLRRSARVTLQLKRKRGRPLGSTKAKGAGKGGAKRAKCTICGKRLKDRWSLKRHQIRMHGIGASGNAVIPAAVVVPDVGQAIPGTSEQVVQGPEIGGVPPNEVPVEANKVCDCEPCTNGRAVALPVEVANIKMEKE